MVFALLAALGSAAVAVGSLMTWATVQAPMLGQMSIKGSDTAQGILLLVLGIAGVIAGLVGVLPGPRRAMGIIALLAAAPATALAVTDVVQLVAAKQTNIPLSGLPAIPSLSELQDELPTEEPTADEEMPEEEPTETPAEEETTPGALGAAGSALHVLAAPLRQAATIEIGVEPGLWIVLGGGLVALVGALGLAFSRQPERAPLRAPV
jgi:hypothetical protein